MKHLFRCRSTTQMTLTNLLKNKRIISMYKTKRCLEINKTKMRIWKFMKMLFKMLNKSLKKRLSNSTLDIRTEYKSLRNS